MTRFPSSLDTDVDIAPIIDGSTEISADTVNAIRDAVLTIEQVLGINPQGSADSVVERLDAITNSDGTFKSSALVASGLISLPIANSQISGTAAIEESKLDLDYPTQDLRDDIDSNDIDIQNLQTLSLFLQNKLALHIDGNDLNHDGYDISLTDLLGNTNIDSVGLALDYILDSLNRHKSSTTVGEHNASAIRFEPTADGVIDDDNVQDAIASIDTSFVEDRRQHNDSAHSNGISKDGYYAFGGQANTNDASARLSRYQTFSGQDIIKIGLINSSIIKTKGFNYFDLTASAQSISFEVQIGNATSSIDISGLHTAAYPTASNRFGLKAVVDYLNTQFASVLNHFPLQAYECDDGEIAIQHNIARDDCTITVRNPPSTSAVDALGLTDLVSFEVGPAPIYKVVVNGRPYDELRTIASGNLTQASPSSVIDLGESIETNGIIGFGISANSLFNVFNHTDSTANGTYSIQTISHFPATTLNLNTSLAAGTFDYIVYGDTIDIGTPTSPRTYDFYLDDFRFTSAQVRAEIPIIGISGIALIFVSPKFSTTTGILTVNNSAGQYVFTLAIGSDTGLEAAVDIGYLGYLNVYAPNNLDYITIFIFATSISTPSSDSIDFEAAVPQDTLYYLGSSSFDAASTVEIPLDRRNVGLVGEQAIGTEVEDGLINRNVRNLSSSGVVRGLEQDFDSTTITIGGGSAYVNGFYVEISSIELSVLSQANSNGTWTLVLESSGKFSVFNETTAGYSFEELLSNPIYCIMCQFVVSSGAISELTDARYFINNLPVKVSLIVDDRDFGAGTTRSLEAAILLADNTPSNGKPDISVISDLTLSENLDIVADKNISIFSNFTLDGNISIGARSKLAFFNDVTIDGDISLDENAELIFHSNATIDGTITISNNCVLSTKGILTVSQIVVDGYGITISGINTSASQIIFDGSTTSGINISDDSANIHTVSLLTPNAVMAAIKLNTGSDNARIEDCIIKQNYTINETNWATTGRAGILANTGSIDGILISNCLFNNWANAISSTGGASYSNLLVDRCVITNCGRGFAFETISSSSIVNNIVSTIKFAHFSAVTSMSDTLISNNIFETESSTSTSLIMASVASVSDSSFDGNIFRNADCSSVLSFSASGITIKFIGNVIDGCTTDNSYCLDLVNATSSVVDISNNIINNHTGNVVSASDCSFKSNIINATFNTSTVDSVIFAANSEQSIIDANLFDITSNKGISLTDVKFSNNIVNIGYATASSTSIGSAISHNRFNLTDASQLDGFILGPSSTTFFTEFSSNDLQTAASSSSLLVSGNGKNKITDNIIYNNTADSVIHLDSGSGMSIISDNFLSGGSGTDYMILAERSNLSILNNTMTESSAAVAPSVAAISMVAGTTDILVENNHINSTASGATIIEHLDTAPVKVAIGKNKGIAATFAYSAISGFRSSFNYIDGAGQQYLESASSSASLSIPLPNLPIGAKITSVVIFLVAPSVGCITATLYKRSASALGATAISAGATNAASGVTSATMTPSSTHYVLSDTEYLVFCDVTAASLDIGSFSVNLVY